MENLIQLDPKVKEEIKEAWSFCEEPPGTYIGSDIRGGKMYHYYKKGVNYFFENDFDMEMREKEKERKRYKWKGQNRKRDGSRR
ncbi:MAG: hypothetical protein LBN31_07550 [Hungatella sp.]|jgi:hypothetical protein|nr:hypothetical protein [Hungatella sp.]